MAELDYAFLADYASVQNSKLTTLGASFTYVQALELPTLMRLYVAGRIRATVEEDSARLTVRVVSPAPGFDIEFDGSIAPAPDQRPYNGKVGLLFALEIPLPLHSEGLYEIFVGVDGVERRLAFDVEIRSES